MLFKSTMTEEIHEAGCDEDEAGKLGNDLKKDGDPYTSCNKIIPESYWQALADSGLGMASPEHVSKQFIPDILTPPPNSL